MKKTTKKLLIIAFAAIMMIALAAMIFKQQDSINSVDDLTNQLNNTLALENQEGKILNQEVANKEVRRINIPGFEEMESDAFPMNLSNEQITIEAIGRFSGPYVEDGSNQDVDHVASILVKNDSDQTIEVALISFENQQNTPLQFMAVCLPPHSLTLVMESMQYELKDDDKLTYTDCAISYKEGSHMMRDQLEVTYQDQKITLNNLSEQDLGIVHVYYKNKVNDIYLGGITYRTAFNDVKGNSVYQEQAVHFNQTSEVVYIGAQYE